MFFLPFLKKHKKRLKHSVERVEGALRVSENQMLEPTVVPSRDSEPVFPRPKNVPETWIQKDTKFKDGTMYIKPESWGKTKVRMMKKKFETRFESLRRDYVTWERNDQSLNKDGQVIKIPPFRPVFIERNLDLNPTESTIAISLNFIRRLERLSDWEQLRYEWLESQEGDVSCFQEDYYYLFWNTGVAMPLEDNLTVFGPKIDGVIGDFKSMFEDLYACNYPEHQILNLPQMDTIGAEAARIADMLKKRNPNEGVTFQWISPGEKK